MSDCAVTRSASSSRRDARSNTASAPTPNAIRSGVSSGARPGAEHREHQPGEAAAGRREPDPRRDQHGYGPRFDGRDELGGDQARQRQHQCAETESSPSHRQVRHADVVPTGSDGAVVCRYLRSSDLRVIPQPSESRADMTFNRYKDVAVRNRARIRRHLVERGLFIAASGMLAAQIRQDVIANNLANATNPGFKREVLSQTAFGDLLLSNTPDRRSDRAAQPRHADHDDQAEPVQQRVPLDAEHPRPGHRRQRLLRRADRPGRQLHPQRRLHHGRRTAS